MEKPAPESRSKAADESSPATAKKPALSNQDTPGPGWGEMARRKFVWSSIFGFLAACLGATAKFFYPRALFEPKTRFVIGYPSDFALGVDTRFQQSNRIWVVRDSSKIYVIFANCTHLGCTPDWNAAENKFKCPCHGSGFDTEGINFEGPAPRPLARVHVELDAEGRIVVDRSILYATPEQWTKENASLAAV